MDAARTTLPMTRRVKRALGLGFTVLILLMAGLATHAVWHIHDLENRMRGIVEVQNLKIQLATDLLEAAYNRHSALIYQTLTTDPFERDDNFQLFVRWGYFVGKARNDLKTLALDDYEKVNLQHQDQWVALIVGVQERISDLAARGHFSEAQALIEMELRPLNLQFTEAIESLRRHERDAIRTALLSTQAATHQAINVHVALGGVLLLLSIFIAYATQRQLSRHAHTIDAQVSALEKASDLLEHQATHDALTGLANRALFYQRLQSAIVHAEQEGFKVGVIYLDLDNFKPINDRYGHACGDLLLKTVAARLKRHVRVSDTVARLGGDEFAIVLVGADTEGVGSRMYAELTAEIAQPVDVGPDKVTPGCSIGCAIYPKDGGNADELINTADLCMYEDKQQRKRLQAEATKAISESAP